MILVDTTVWIDLFRNRETREVVTLTALLEEGEDICTCGVIVTEVLQGIRDDREHARTRRALEVLISLPMTHETFVRAAEIYRDLRKRGLTIRNSIDCMIAAVAIEHDVALLHNDKDYSTIATLGALKIRR